MAASALELPFFSWRLAVNARVTVNDVAWGRALDALKPAPAQLEHGLELHRESIVFDAFGFAPYTYTRRMVEEANRLIDAGALAEVIQEQMQERRFCDAAADEEGRAQYQASWERSGVTATMQTCGGQAPVAKAMRHLSRFFMIWDAMPDFVRKGTTSQDVREAKAAGRRCQFISMNGLPGLHELAPDDALNMVDVMHHLGMRMMHLTYNVRNVIGDGCIERANAGLSEFGREVIERMNDAGVMVDTAHTGRQTSIEAARASRAPVVASHTVCDALFHHDRAKDDEQMKIIVDSGGFVGMAAVPTFLAEAGKLPHLLDHIDHAVKVIGAENVAIGTDAWSYPDEPEGIKLKPMPPNARKNRMWRPEHRVYVEGVSEDIQTGTLRWTNWPLYTVGLVQRGYSDEQIRGIIGGNVMRVLDAVAKAAKR